MRLHTNNFKESIKEFGRVIDSKILCNGEEIDAENLYSISPTTNTDILKSVMKQLDFEADDELNINDIITYKFGLYVNNGIEWLDYGNYVIYSKEYNEDTKTYNYVCYDKMLFSMIDYTELQHGTFPMSVRDFINNVCLDLGLEFANVDDEFANYDRIIPEDRYKEIGYTYRDVLDDLAQVTASNIIINNNDELEIHYIQETNDTIDEEFINDINVKFKEKFGPVNSIVLSRSAGSDNIYIEDEESVEENGLTEIKISDNQIMNFDDRADYLPDILEKLNGLEYYLNDYNTTGVLYYEVGDLYNVQITDDNDVTKTYKCLLLNNEQKISQGLEEKIYTERADTSPTDYNTSSKDDREKNRTTLIVDKVNGTITGVVEKVEELSDDVNKSLENIKAQYQYELTKDETYQRDKTYYVYNSGENKYEAFESYSVGDTIPENTIYEYVKIKDSIEDSLTSKYNELLDRFTQYTPTSQLDSIINKVVQEQTDTYTKTEIQQIANGTGVDGVKVTAVISTEATFDKDGMHYAKTGAKANSTINQDGLEVDGVGSEGVYLYAGYVEQNDNRFNTSTRTFNGSSIVYTRNLKTTGDTIIGNHCLIMDYEDDGYNGTGWFNI